MPTELQGLSVTKVALCGRGMNPEAEVMLFKSAETPSNPQEAPVAPTPGVWTAPQPAADEICGAVWSFRSNPLQKNSLSSTATSR